MNAVTAPSVCPLDCPDTCSLSVTVEEARISAVRGSRANPFTDGAICAKVSKLYPEFVHGDNRLRQPLLRDGPRGSGEFTPVDWDTALARVHEGLSRVIAEHGPQAVLPLNYAGPHGMLSGDSLSLRFFHRLGATQLYRRALCGGVRDEAHSATYGAMPGISPESVDDSRLIIVWGNNATVCNLHLVRHINIAKRAGAKLVVIDPKRIRVAEQADLHIALKPGTDVVLALAMAAELERTGGLDRDFIHAHLHGADEYLAAAREYPLERAAELCDVPLEQLRSLCDWYRDLAPAAIAWGNGLERNQNGGSGLRAIAALPALAGKWGVRGGGLVAAAGRAFPKTGARLTRPDLVPPGTRTVNILDVARHLGEDDLDPPIRAVFIYNHNPLIVHPEQNRMREALSREEIFTVGCEVAMTDSMAYCDVVLPACTHFEHHDLYCAYGQQYLQRAAPVVPPVGESLPNTEIFRRLARHFGFEPALFPDDATLMDEALDAEDPRLKGYRPSELPLDGALRMTVSGEEILPFVNIFPATDSGKVELLSEVLAGRCGMPLPVYRPVADHYPLTLISPASDQRITSTFGGLAASGATPVLEMHPDDASARGLQSGMRVKVWNDLGEVHLPLVVTDAVRRGCVYSEKGAWLRTSDNGQTVSALAPASKADLAEGACYNDARVEVAGL